MKTDFRKQCKEIQNAGAKLASSPYFSEIHKLGNELDQMLRSLREHIGYIATIDESDMGENEAKDLVNDLKQTKSALQTAMRKAGL